MKKNLLFLFIYLLSYGISFSQETDRDQLFDDAEFFFATGEYEEALYLFLELLKLEPENANFNYRTGMTYLNIPGKEFKAVPYLEKAIQNTTMKYRERDLDEDQAPHHALFYLGNAYRINNQLEEALETYEKFMDIRKFEKKYNLRIVENEIAAVERAKIIKDAPLNLKRQNPGNTINEGRKNYHPVVNYDESAMVFMRSQKFYEAILYTYKKDGRWVEPLNITPMVGSDGEMLPAALSADGKKLLLVKKTKRDEGDIYISEFKDNLWSTAEKLGKNINTSRSEGHASFSPDGKKLYFSSARRGGTGGLDLYVSSLETSGEWGPAVNLGPTINTPEDETSVFVTEDNNKLFFSSKAHYNMGGYDMFYVEKSKDGNWGDIVNLGYPINTTNNNDFYQPTGKGDSGYLAVFSPEGTGKEDIFRVEILPYTDPQAGTGKPFTESFTLILKDDRNGKKTEIIYDHQTGDFKVASPSGQHYSIMLKDDKGN